MRPEAPGHDGGFAAEQAARDARTADLASQFRLKVLSKVMEKIEEGADPLEVLSKDVRGVLEYSENRAHGTPRQSVEHSGSVDHKHSARNMTDDELAAYLRNDTDQG